MNISEYFDVEWDDKEEEFTLKCGREEGHWLADLFEGLAKTSWDPTEPRVIAQKIRDVLPPDDRPKIEIVLVPR